MVFGYGYMKFISQLVDHWRHDIHRFPNGNANVRIIGEIPVSKNRDISLSVRHACFIMSSIWPAEFLVSTLFIICVMRWSVSVINVVRTVPIYSRPAIFFFCHTPNAWFISVDVSLSSVNGGECLSANFSWLAGESLLMKII